MIANLTVICSSCNEAPDKGLKPVHSAGSFADWFHPYLRPGSGVFQLLYDSHAAAVHCSAVAPADQPKAVNLDRLLNLASRWTREFKAEYVKHQDILRRGDPTKQKRLRFERIAIRDRGSSAGRARASSCARRYEAAAVPERRFPIAPRLMRRRGGRSRLGGETIACG